MARQSGRSRQSVRSADRSATPTVIEQVMDVDDSSLLDVLDHILAKGVMATGDLTLGVAGIDLIYVRLSALLCAADRVLPSKSSQNSERATRNRSRRRTARRTP